MTIAVHYGAVLIQMICPGSTVIIRDHLGLVATKPVFGVSDKASFKPVSSATETS